MMDILSGASPLIADVRKIGRISPHHAQSRCSRTGPDLRIRWWRGRDLNARPSGYESADGMLVHSATCRMGRLTCYFGVERGRLMSARNGLGRFIRERRAVGAFGV